MKFDLTKYVGAKSKCLDVSKMRSAMPQLKFRDIEEGLKETINWFAENFYGK